MCGLTSSFTAQLLPIGPLRIRRIVERLSSYTLRHNSR
ncbi:hypothetical protein JNB_15008 [Janibacter sp. HTCC2649]|nr:hypothetical protein JNB_15008 [Janibacter sp. HTCC2649]